MQPDEIAALKSALDLVLGLCALVGALATGLGFVVGKWRKERKVISDLVARLDTFSEHLRCVENQNEARATLAQANLRLSFAVAQELVSKGANGELKRAVNDLRDLMVELSIPPRPSSDLDRPLT